MMFAPGPLASGHGGESPTEPMMPPALRPRGASHVEVETAYPSLKTAARSEISDGLVFKVTFAPGSSKAKL